MYRPPHSSSASASAMYGGQQPLYPKIGPHPHAAVGRPSPYQQSSTPSSSGLGIKVAIKPEYRITPPPHLSPHVGDIPRSKFQFDFGLERKILAEAQKENPNWSKFGTDNLPPKVSESSSSSSKASAADPIVSKYVAMGLNQEAVAIAIVHYGDNPTKVQEFAKGYTVLQEMGFSSSSVTEALVMNDNDTNKALAHFL